MLSVKNDSITRAYFHSYKSAVSQGKSACNCEESRQVYRRYLKRDPGFKALVVDISSYKETHNAELFYKRKIKRWKEVKKKPFVGVTKLRCRICDSMVDSTQFIVTLSACLGTH